MGQIDRAITLDAEESVHPEVAGRADDRAGSDAIALIKPGIVRLVTITSGVGLALASIGQELGAWTLALLIPATLAGTALCAAGANTLNQAVERRRDSLMQRTAGRPVAAGRWSPRRAAIYGLALSLLGTLALWFGANAGAAMVAVTTIVLYVGVYTPLKSVSPLATIVGAVPGALPPMIGWAAGSPGPDFGLLAPGGWSLFLIVFVWQIPHFLAIAWKYREEYARAGICVLPVLDPDGHRTGPVVVLWSLTLIMVSLMPLWSIGAPLGAAYGAVALAGGLAMLGFGVRFALSPRGDTARSLFLASVIHLPIVMFVLVGDAFLGV